MFNVRMPDGSIVQGHWGYAPGGEREHDAFIAQLAPRTVSVWAVNPAGGVAESLGSGFVIRSGKNSQNKLCAVVVTAEHVVAQAIRALRPDLLRQTFGPFATPLGKLLFHVLRARSLHVRISVEGKPVTLRVGRLSILPGSDLAMLIAISDRTEPDFPHFAINSDRLNEGTMVMMAGFPREHPNEPARHQVLADGRNQVEREVRGVLEMRTGVITGVHDRTRHCAAFCYETSISMPNGISGGPVFAFVDQATGHRFSPFDVVAVCSSDATAREHQDDVTAPGSSFCVGAENLYGLCDPVLPNIEAWQNRKEGEAVRPPFGTFIVDRGQRSGELAVSLSDDAISVVRRNS